MDILQYFYLEKGTKMKKRLISLFLISFLLFSLLPTSANAANSTSDFLIDNGVLIRYSGTSSNIVIPKGVTTIAEA